MGNGQQKTSTYLPQVLMLGLDGAGKTTILHKLKERKDNNTTSTVGFNVETINKKTSQDSKTFPFTLWDVGGLGGEKNIRYLWDHHLTSREYHGIIYVVDCSDRARLFEAKQELFTRVLEKPHTKGLPLVVIANKQDLTDAISGDKLAHDLGLARHLDHPWHVVEVSAKTGQGLTEALDRIYSLIRKPVCGPTSQFYP